jgi:hypothetical protein
MTQSIGVLVHLVKPNEHILQDLQSKTRDSMHFYIAKLAAISR